MRVAVLFYGQPRYLDNPRPEDAYHRELFSRYNCTNFVHTWWGHDIKEYDTSTWVASSIQPDPEAVTKIVQKYTPESITIDTPKKFSIPEDMKAHLDQNFEYKELNVRNIFSHMYSISTVSNKAAYWSIVGEAPMFDWYILARTDMVIRNIPDLWSCDNTKLYLPNNHTNFPDTVVAFGPKFLEWAGLTFTDMIVPEVYKNIREPTPESFKMETFKLHHNVSDIVQCSMYGDVVRSNR